MGGPPAPPRRRLRRVAGPRPRYRLAVRLRPGRCPASGRVASPAPLPSAPGAPAERREPGPRRARAPLGAPGPRPLGPRLTVSVAPAKGRDATGTAGSPPPFLKRAPAPHLTVTPLWGGGRWLRWRLFLGFLIGLALPRRQSRLSGPPRLPAH